MKKLVNPNLDLMPRGNKILEQIKNMDSKQRQEMFSSLLPNTFFCKPKKKKLPGAPFDEKLQIQEKIQQNSTNSFAIGWTGQATTKSLKPKVEVASKYPFDIDSAFFDYTDIEKLNTKKSGKGYTKKRKKVGHKRIKKTITHALTSNTKAKKSVQLFKEIPKSHISKLHRLNAERRERALQQSVLEPLQEVYISDSPTNKSTITEVYDSKGQPISTNIDGNSNSDTTYQLLKDTVSRSVAETEFQEEKELKNTGMAYNCEESSQNDHSQNEKQTNSIHEKSQGYEKHDKRLITNQICPNENISPETNKETQNTDEFVLTNLKGKCAEIKYHQKIVDSRPGSETAHQVDSTTNKIGSIFPNISKYDDINLAKVKDLEKGYEMENNPHFSINDNESENYSYLNNKNTADSTVKTDADQINQIALSNKPTKNGGKGLSEETLSLSNESRNSNSTCVNSKTNRRLDPILEKIGLTNTPIKNVEKENNFKQLSPLSYKNPINLNQLQYLKNKRSPEKNDVVYYKELKKEELDFNIDTSFSKSSSKVKNKIKVENTNIYKKHLNKNVDLAEGKFYSNNKILKNVKESFVVSKPQKKRKKNLGTELLKDLSNSLILRTELSSPTNTTQKLNNKSTEPLANMNKSYHVTSPKTSKRRQKCQSKIDEKIFMIKGKESKVDINRSHPYLNSLNKGSKDSSKLKNNEPMLLKSKQIEDSYNISNVTDPKKLSPNSVDKFKEIVKKPKNVVLVKSNYVKFVENKAWFLGSPSKSLISKPENNIGSADTTEQSKHGLKFASLKLTDTSVQNKGKVFTKIASPENTNKSNELKDIQANEEKHSHNLEKYSNLDKRILKIKTGINDPKTNKTCVLLRKVKPSREVLDSNVQQAVNKQEKKQNNSIIPNFEEQKAKKVDGKVTHNNARSTLTRKIELVSNKTKPSAQLSKSFNEVSKSVFSKGNNSDDVLIKTNTALHSVEDQSAKQQNNLNYNASPVSTNKFKKTRKLHSRKLGSKYSDLKMYGEEKNISPLTDVRSLKSTQVVHKKAINKTNEVSSLETRNCLARNFRSEIRQSSNKMYPFAVQNRNLYTIQDTPCIMVSYLSKRLLTTTAANKIENYYFDLSNTNGSFQRGESMVKAKSFFNDNFAAKTNNVKRTIIRNGIDKIQKILSEPEPADILKRKGKKNNITEVSFKKFAERGIPMSAEKPLTQKTDHSFEVLYERNKIKSKDCFVKTLQKKDSKFDIRTSKNTSGVALKKFNSNKCSNISHSPIKYDYINKTKSAISNNTNSTLLKKLETIPIPQKIMNNNDLSLYKAVSTMSDKKTSEKENNETIFEINDNDLTVMKPFQTTHLTNYKKQNGLHNEPKGNNELEKKGLSLVHVREDFPKELISDKPESFKNHFEPFKGNKSLPNLMYTYLEPVSLSVIEPLRWRSKSERLKSFQFKASGSEVRNIKKRTLIKSSIIYNNNKSNNSVTLNNNTSPTTNIDKLVFVNTNNTSIQTSKRKENRSSNVNSFSRDGKKQVDAKTKNLDKATSVGNQISNKDVILINAKQKSILPLEHKLVSKTSLNKNSLCRNVFKIPHKFDVIGKNVKTDTVELVKRPVSKPILNEHKSTVSNTILDSRDANNLAHGKQSEIIVKNKGTIGNFLNYQKKNSFKNKNIKLNLNQSTLAMQTVNKNNKTTTNQNFSKKDEKCEKEKLEPKKPQKTNETKTVRNLNSIDCSTIKMEVEPNVSAATFNFNFNLPINIMAQNFKNVKDSPARDDKENPESIKETNTMQHYKQFQLLKTGISNKHKQAISVMEKQEDAQDIACKIPLKLNNLSSFKPTLRPIIQKNETMRVQTVSDINEKNISRKKNDKCDENNSSKPHKLYIPKPLLPFNTVNRKSHLMEIKSRISKQTQSKTMNGVIVTGTDKKYFSKPLKFPVGLLAKHFMKKEKRLTEDKNKEENSNKLETEKKPNISKIVKNTKAEPKITTKTISIPDEKEKKSNIKKELNLITGSNLTLNFDKLIKSKGRDKFYISRTRTTEKAQIRQDDRGSVSKGQSLKVNKKSKNLIISANLGNNSASASNKCLEKIVDYGIKQSRSTLQREGLITGLKMKKSSESFTDNHKAKNIVNKPSLVNSANVQTQDKLSSPISSEIGKNSNFPLSTEDIGRMKKKIRSKNTFRVFKGNQIMKKRQLQLIDRKKCEKKVQLKNENITRGNLSKVPNNNYIYLSPVNPKSKGIYVVEIKPSIVKDPSINSSSEVLKGSSTVSFNKSNIQNNISHPKTNALKSFRSR